MTDLPTGTLTILFTDLVEHTALYTRLGESTARDVILAHFRVLRTVIAAHDGREIKSEGDRLMVIFTSTNAAVHAAIEMQQSVARANQVQPRHALHMRIGINAGEPVADRGDLYGTPVIVAGRLCDQAAGDEILVSEVVRLLAGPRLAPHFSRERVLELKGITEPTRAYSVEWEAEAEAPVHGRSAFVGRRQERSLLMERLDAARQGQGGLVFLAGEPGIGKTRLALEVTASARALACQTFTGQAYDMKGMPPYLLFIEALRGYIAECDATLLEQQIGEHGPVLAKLFPALRQRLPGLAALRSLGSADDPQISMGPYLILEAVAALLGAIAREAPVVLVLDELQWSDQESLTLMQHLARDINGRAMLLIGAYRPAEVPPPHPLVRMMADLSRRRLYQLVSLAPLARTESEALVAGLLKGAPAPQVAAAIHRQTEGNPFFIEEVVAHLVEQGYDLADPATNQQDWSIPESLRQVVGARLARLDTDTVDMLTAVSILGDPFSFEEVRAFSTFTPEALVDALDAAIGAGILREAEGGYEFSHALIGETLLSALTTPRYQRLHARAARALEERHAGRLDECIAELAYHERQAGPLADPAAVVAHSTRAGDLALEVLAYDKALEHYLAGLATQTRMPVSDPAVAAALHVKLGHAQRGSAAWDDALASYSRAIDLYTAMPEPERLAEAYYFRARVHTRRRDYADALADLDVAKGMIRPDQHGLMSSVLEQVAQNLVTLRRYAPAEAAAGEAVQLAEIAGRDDLAGEALFAVGYAHLMSLRLRDSATAFRQVRTLSSPGSVGPETWDLAAATRGAIALIGIGQVDEAAAWAGQARDFLDRVDNPYQRGWTRMSLATLALLHGDFAAAEMHAVNGLEETRRGPNLLAMLSLTLLRTLTACDRGDFSAAEGWAAQLLLGDNRTGRPDEAVGGWAYPLLVRVLSGDLEAGRAAAPFLAARFNPRPPDIQALTIYVSLAEIALRLHDAGLATLPFDALKALHASGAVFTVGWPALIPRLLGGICRLRGEHEAATRYLDEALALATRIDAGPELVRTHIEYAWLGLKQGSGHGAVLGHLKSASATAERLGMHGHQPEIDRLLDQIRPLVNVVARAPVAAEPCTRV